MNHRVFVGLLFVAAGCSQGSTSVPLPPAVDRPALDAGDTGLKQVDTKRFNRPSMLDTLTASERNHVEDEIDSYAAAMSVTHLTGFVPIRFRARPVSGYPGLYEFVVNNTGSGWVEKFLLQTPPTFPTAPAPLLCVFHKFGSSHADVLNTTFLTESRNRGWFCISPLGARQKNFGNFESQINTKVALELVRSLYPIDTNRVYGVGFSMGGGTVANYAARHVDPNSIMFAAIVNHTGGVSLANTYANEPDDNDADDNTPNIGDNLEVPDTLESLFGGSPSAQPFWYQRCSTIDLDPFTNQVGVDTDFARNLAHVPTMTWLAMYDPFAYLYNQSSVFSTRIAGQNVSNNLHLVNANVHQWTTLDCAYACDWLQQFTLQIPSSGSSIADEDGQWFRFQIEQDAAGSFTPFTWSVDVPNRRIDLSATRNLKRIKIDRAALGLPTSGPLTLSLATADGLADQVQILGVNSPPTVVARDGSGASGVYDAALHTFQVNEPDGAHTHQWTLVFP